MRSSHLRVSVSTLMRADAVVPRVESMGDSYAVVWCEGQGPRHLGKLEIDDHGVHLTGCPGGRVIRPGDIAGAHVEHPGTGVFFAEMRGLVLDRDGGEPITIGAVNGIGIVFEVANLVADLARGPDLGRSGIAVRVPIHQERVEKVRELVRNGPPFDPSTIAGLDRHQVFVGDHEVVFTFEGYNVKHSVERLILKPRVWLAATAWRDCLAGPPELMESGYSWSLPAEHAR